MKGPNVYAVDKHIDKAFDLTVTVEHTFTKTRVFPLGGLERFHLFEHVCFVGRDLFARGIGFANRGCVLIRLFRGHQISIGAFGALLLFEYFFFQAGTFVERCIAALLAVAFGFAACARHAAQPSGTVLVAMADNSFSPSIVRVPVGGSVVFMNAGRSAHNAVAIDRGNRLYMAWQDSSYPDQNDDTKLPTTSLQKVAYSDDEGRTWSKPFDLSTALPAGSPAIRFHKSQASSSV